MNVHNRLRNCKFGKVRTGLFLVLLVSAIVQLQYITEMKQIMPKLQSRFGEWADWRVSQTEPGSAPNTNHHLRPVPIGQPCGELPSQFPDSIPSVVHWSSRNGRVAAKLIPFVRSWRQLLHTGVNGTHKWHFMHWDDMQISELISKHYPHLIRSYRKLVNGLERSDIGRLAVLHHIGGLYVDMDVELLRDPTPMLRPSQLLGAGLSPNFSCQSAVWSQEPPVHPVFIFNMSSLISNAVILTRANHSFLSFVLNNWPSWFEGGWAKKTKRLDSEAVFVTGPMMLQTFYNNYTALQQSDRPEDWCGNMLAEPDAFQPISDSYYGPKRMKSVVCTNASNLNAMQQLHCEQMSREKFKEKRVPNSSYTVHRFMHLSYANRLKMAGSSALSTILPIVTCRI